MFGGPLRSEPSCLTSQANLIRPLPALRVCVCAKCRMAVVSRTQRLVVAECSRASEYVTSPPAPPQPRLSGRLIHAKARPPRCSDHVPSPGTPPRLVPPDPCLHSGGVSHHRAGTWPPPRPLSFLSPHPPRRPHWGVHNEASHLHSGSNRKWSRPQAAGGYFTSWIQAFSPV